MKQEASVFGLVKEAVTGHFGDSENARNLIQNAIAANLCTDDLVGSLHEMDRTLEKAKFN